jgi:hypothetical protein
MQIIVVAHVQTRNVLILSNGDQAARMVEYNDETWNAASKPERFQ